MYKQPEKFDVNKPSEWKAWRSKFMAFRMLNKLDKESDEMRVCSLKYLMGMPASENIYETFCLDYPVRFDCVLHEFNNYFNRRENLVHLRAEFDKRVQYPHETIEQFSRELHILAEDCEFKDLEERIRDRLVVGLQDGSLSDRLQMEADLTLAEAIDIVRQCEQVVNQKKERSEARRYFAGGRCFSKMVSLCSILFLPIVIACWFTTFNGLIFALSSAIFLFGARRYFAGGRCYSKTRLDGKVAIVTGANTGIGKETARNLLRRGAKVILACRDVKKAEMAAADLRVASGGNGNAVVKRLDLASFQSVRDFCKDVLDAEKEIHLLINNAGVMACPELKTEDGNEMQFGVNHLGHFLLTHLLLDRLKESAPARIVTVASMAHEKGEINFGNVNLNGEYDRNKAYCQSKLANVLFTRELNKRLQSSGVSAFCLHPDVVETEIFCHFFDDKPYIQCILSLFARIAVKNSVEGSQTSVYCAVEEGIEKYSGCYFKDCEVVTLASAEGRDDAAAEKLWKLSERMTGISK